MKYIKQLPKTDLNLKKRLEKDGWIKIKEPKNLPLAILLVLKNNPCKCISCHRLGHTISAVIVKQVVRFFMQHIFAHSLYRGSNTPPETPPSS